MKRTRQIRVSLGLCVVCLAMGACGDDGVGGGDGGGGGDGVAGDGAAAGDDAEFVSQNVPGTVPAGAAFQAQLTLRNTGTTTWSEAAEYRLGSQTPQDNQVWGLGRLEIGAGVEVAPGETYTFDVDLTAPATPMEHPMQWRMVHENVGWFGETTDLLTIDVTDDCADHCSNGLVDCGETYIDCGGDCLQVCQPVELADVTASGGYPRIAVASPGKVMVVWHRSAPGTDNILRWRCWGGEGWTPIDQVTPGTGTNEYPWIVTDSQGRFHLAHNRGFGDGRHPVYNRFDAADCDGQWHDPGEALVRELLYSASYPAITVDENDSPYITYSQSQAPRVSPFPDCGAGGVCGPNEHCYGTSPGICIPDYEQHFARRTGGAFGSGTWTAPVDLSVGIPGARFSHHGAIYALSSTSVHAVWLQGDPNRDIWYAQFDGAQWSPAEYTGLGAHMADVAVDAQTVHVFSNKAQYATRPVAPFSGAPWAPFVTVPGGSTINFVRLILTSGGGLHAVWNASYRIAYSMTDTNGDWLPTKLVSPEGEECHEPSLDVDVDGNAHFVWTECTPPACSGEFGSVWYLKTRYDELP